MAENKVAVYVEVKGEAAKSLQGFSKTLDQTEKSARKAAGSFRKMIRPTADLKKGLEVAAKAQFPSPQPSPGGRGSSGQAHLEKSLSLAA